MELEGLKRGIAKLKELELEMRSLVTDRHIGIANYMKSAQPDIDHYFDCWHVAKCKSEISVLDY